MFRYFYKSILLMGIVLLLTFGFIILYTQNTARQFNTGISPSELTALYMEPVIVGFGVGAISLALIVACWHLFLNWTGEPSGVSRQRQKLMHWSLFGLPLLVAALAAVTVVAYFPEPYLTKFFLSAH